MAWLAAEELPSVTKRSSKGIFLLLPDLEPNYAHRSVKTESAEGDTQIW